MEGDTQLVRWTLAQACPLRSTEVATPYLPLPGDILANTLRNGAANSDDLTIFNDVYITSGRSGNSANPGSEHPDAFYPDKGFLVDREFRAVGGVAGLFNLCGTCPANTRKLAGCEGSIELEPDSPLAEKQLRSIVRRLGLDRELAEAFPPTTPIWYGFWIVSPMPIRSLTFLRRVMSEWLDRRRRELSLGSEINEPNLDSIPGFVAALELAEKSNLQLHVTLEPPGYTSHLLYSESSTSRSIYPHCPVCKAATPGTRLFIKVRYPQAPYTCRVCGKIYSPRETASQKLLLWDSYSLREQLGVESFKAFAINYLIAQGHSKEVAELLVSEREVEQLQKEERISALELLEEKKQRYVRSDLLFGLTPKTPPYDESIPREPWPSEWYGPESFLEILNRCQARGIKLTFMRHKSVCGEKDRLELEMKGIRNPIALFSKWRKAGCNERFHGGYNIPDPFIAE